MVFVFEWGNWQVDVELRDSPFVGLKIDKIADLKFELYKAGMQW